MPEHNISTLAADVLRDLRIQPSPQTANPLSDPDLREQGVENRPYEDWWNRTRLDAWLRGWLFPDPQDEWRRSGIYRPEQTVLLEEMQNYLRTGFPMMEWP